MVFYQVFQLSTLQCTVNEKPNCRNCKRLREFEEIEISRQTGEVTVNSKEENTSFKNSTSDHQLLNLMTAKVNRIE
jgi:hypothetical protein